MLVRIAWLVGCCFLTACATDPGDDSASNWKPPRDAGPAPTGFEIDYSIWQLQLPSGGSSPNVIPPGNLGTYADAYFSKADDGGQIFMDPTTGVTTGGSSHPRTELREVKANNSGMLWSPAGTNTLTVTGKAIACSSCTIGQIFDSSGSNTLVELQYSSSGAGGGMKLFYEEAKGAGNTPLDLGVQIPLGEPYTFTLGFSNNLVTVSVDEQQVYMHVPSASVLDDEFYFKAGDYDQKAVSGPVSTDVSSQIENYSIVVVHE